MRSLRTRLGTSVLMEQQFCSWNQNDCICVGKTSCVEGSAMEKSSFNFFTANNLLMLCKQLVDEMNDENLFNLSNAG